MEQQTSQGWISDLYFTHHVRGSIPDANESHDSNQKKLKCLCKFFESKDHELLLRSHQLVRFLEGKKILKGSIDKSKNQKATSLFVGTKSVLKIIYLMMINITLYHVFGRIEQHILVQEASQINLNSKKLKKLNSSRVIFGLTRLFKSVTYHLAHFALHIGDVHA